MSSQPVIHVWQARLAPNAKPYPGYHRLHGLEVVPVSVLLQTLLTAAGELGVAAVSAVRFEQPIMLDRPKVIQVVADGDSLRITAGSAVDGSPEPVDHPCDSTTLALRPGDRRCGRARPGSVG